MYTGYAHICTGHLYYWSYWVRSIQSPPAQQRQNKEPLCIHTEGCLLSTRKHGNIHDNENRKDFSSPWPVLHRTTAQPSIWTMFSDALFYICCCDEVYRQKHPPTPPSCSLAQNLTLAAAATLVCAFVTVATNSKARQRCSIAVDVKASRAGLPSNTHMSAYVHTQANTCQSTCLCMNPNPCAFAGVFISTYLDTATWRWGGGSPSYSKQAGGDGEAAGILSPHYQHTGKTESSSEINRSTVETIQWEQCVHHTFTWRRCLIS